MNLPVNTIKRHALEALYAACLITVGVCATNLWFDYHPELIEKHEVITTTYRLNGDVNQDGVVDLLDISIISSNYGKKDMGWNGGDLNGDGIVDGLDLSICTHNKGDGNTKAKLI